MHSLTICQMVNWVGDVKWESGILKCFEMIEPHRLQCTSIHPEISFRNCNKWEITSRGRLPATGTSSFNELLF